MAASVQSSSELDLSSIGDGVDEEPLGDLTDEELYELVQKTVYVCLFYCRVSTHGKRPLLFVNERQFVRRRFVRLVESLDQSGKPCNCSNPQLQ